MGTNYYIQSTPCPHCGRMDERLHIGKSSVGWSFLFAGHKDRGLMSWKAWRRHLSSSDAIIIVDEYGKHISLGDFVRCVDGRPTTVRDDNDMPDGFRDSEGYNFSTREFS